MIFSPLHQFFIVPKFITIVPSYWLMINLKTFFKSCVVYRNAPLSRFGSLGVVPPALVEVLLQCWGPIFTNLGTRTHWIDKLSLKRDLKSDSCCCRQCWFQLVQQSRCVKMVRASGGCVWWMNPAWQWGLRGKGIYQWEDDCTPTTRVPQQGERCWETHFTHIFHLGDQIAH